LIDSILKKELKTLLSEAIKKGNIEINSLKGSSKALLFSLIEEESLFICLREEEAKVIYEDALFWSDVMETEPPVFIPPQGDLERIKALQHLYNMPVKKAISSLTTAITPSWTPDALPPIELSEGLEMDRELVVSVLEDEGYVKYPIVTEIGQMSVRGGILDVFPASGSEYPVRIEFFGDTIESIRLFDINSQRTVSIIDNISIPPIRESEGGETLIEFMSRGVLVLDEPNEIKRRYRDVEFNGHKRIAFSSIPLTGEGISAPFSPLSGLGLVKGEYSSVEELPERIKRLIGNYSIRIICESIGQAKRMRDLILENGIGEPPLINRPKDALEHSAPIVITVRDLSSGFVFKDKIFITGRDIFGDLPVKRHKRRSVKKIFMPQETLQKGDYVVHMDYGIGRYLGVVKQQLGNIQRDVMVIEYAGGDKLYVPLDRVDKIKKYFGGDSVVPQLNKLGTNTWQKTKSRIKKKIKDMAEKIVKLHAKRYREKGYAFSPSTELHREFDGFFLYEETPDQLSAIKEIEEDMEDTKPMDRLLCGDVGYGKTEVAMRAAFKAVFDSKQVAVIVPTTVLAEQHYQTFSTRFSAFPVKIDYLSRFKDKKAQRETIDKLSRGEIDIIIGTHRLLSKDITFYDLGLLIIDEEHRFGVTHKEKIKMLKSNIDVLTLTATPIPRTLQMAISGIKSISTLETPPQDRIAVKTVLAKFNRDVIKSAIEYELDRKGQVFFVHNRIESIYRVANFLHELVPHAKITVAHGKMKESELERAMLSFIRGEANVLVSTSIISSGLDIPSTNTIIIDRADRFGLADLYQLRGRVGRSDVRAYAYMLIPDRDEITEDAKKRLEAIEELSYLGAGFRLAMKDLEIRGAGNLLGPEQSGHIEAVGLDMYMSMLKKAVAELKGEEAEEEDEGVNIDLKSSAMIPETYIEEPHIRITMYRRLSSIRDEKQIDEFREE
ncbi:MAG: transcription-repair coupling factor, partial [Nitrospirae bacterium]